MELAAAAQPEHAEHVEAYLAKMRAFLMQPNHANGEWPDISNDELQAGADLAREMFDLKWSNDCDGDSPVRFKLFNRRHFRLLWDIPLANEPREEEADEAAEKRLHSNLRTIAGAIASFGHELNVTHEHLDRINRQRRCNAASFKLLMVDYEKTADIGGDRLCSLHMSQADADAFKPEGLVVKKVHTVRATPDLYADQTDNFAEYRKSISAKCGQVLKRYPDITQLKLRIINPPHESVLKQTV